MSDLITSLKWRYATKRMNGTKIDPSKLKTILEAIQLAPTSVGLMPFNVIVVQDKQVKEKLSPVCFNQPQILSCDTLLVFAAWKTIPIEKINNLIEIHKQINNPSESNLEGLKNSISASANKLPEDLLIHWTTKQAYIGLGFGLVAAAHEMVDSTPMEGFSVEGVNEVLELDKLGLSACVLLALGNRDAENDYLFKLKKVRRPLEQIFINY